MREGLFRRSRLRLLVVSVAAIAAVVAILPAVASAEKNVREQSKAFFDSRQAPTSKKVLNARDAKLAAEPSAAVAALRGQLGHQGIVALDPLTSTPRVVARLDGFLTGPSSAAASAIALGYIRNHSGVFGLDAAVLANLKLVRDYVSIDGTHHLYWQQTVKGVPVFGNGLRANVTKDGRLINVLGSPLATLAPSSSSAEISAGAAVGAAKRDAGLTAVPLKSDGAKQVYFMTTGGPRVAYQTLITDSGSMYVSVVDAATGKILYRKSLVNDASANVLDNYPGAAGGSTRHSVDFDQWLTPGANTLTGPNTHVYSDVNDSEAAEPSEETPKDARGNFNYAFTQFTPAACRLFPCSWDPEVAGSWETNRNQSAAQLFYFINKFHDHLKAAPIGFTPAAGNFEGDDPVKGENLDGADTADGLPDGQHIDNANFGTPPDGISPTMQMFLWHQPGTAFPGEDPFIAANGSDEADIVYHEYTHGLSNRLVVDANGLSTLGGIQAGAMGEAWSDWYAMDLLVKEGFETDTSASGELRIGNYVGWGNDLIRFEPLDCAVGAARSVCPGGVGGAGAGGFTYGDYGRVFVVPEVHSDGEIWVQTLWDLRAALGSNLTEGLVTRAMELSPSNPSFLDMRNSILQADVVATGGANAATIWSVFANRGMGFFSGAFNGDDSQPVENFSPPPGPNAKTSDLRGIVTDVDSGQPVEGAVVAFGGHNSGFPGDFAGSSNAAGRYRIPNIFVGSYPKVFAFKPGWDMQAIGRVTISEGANTQNFAIRRDWAALGGGGEITDFTGPDFTAFGCGPSGGIDQSLGTGWGSTSEWDPATLTAVPKFIVIKLPQPVDLTQFAVDPNATCGDGASASTKDFRIETSTDGVTFVTSAEGSFPSDRSANGHLNPIPVGAGTGDNVQFVKFWMVSPNLLPEQVCPGPFSGCDFMDMSEIEVYGTAS